MPSYGLRYPITLYWNRARTFDAPADSPLVEKIATWSGIEGTETRAYHLVGVRSTQQRVLYCRTFAHYDDVRAPFYSFVKDHEGEWWRVEEVQFGSGSYVSGVGNIRDLVRLPCTLATPAPTSGSGAGVLYPFYAS